MKRPSLGAAANVALIVAAAAVVWNTMRAQPTPASPPSTRVPEQWDQVLAAGIQVGPADAPIQIIELMDFQCPFCRMWHARLDSLISEQPNAVRVSFHHWPLPSHPYALPAAVAAECADRQGVFPAFQRELFEGQALIGTQAWRVFAETAGVPNLDEFEACAALPADSFPRIQHGMDLAQRTGATGTPTIWVNGKVSRPTLQELREKAGER